MHLSNIDSFFLKNKGGTVEMLKDILIKSRSYRGYDESRRITKEELISFVDCTRYSPSSINRQPLRYDLVYTEEDTDKLFPLTGWAKACQTWPIVLKP